MIVKRALNFKDGVLQRETWIMYDRDAQKNLGVIGILQTVDTKSQTENSQRNNWEQTSPAGKGKVSDEPYMTLWMLFLQKW